MLKWIGREKGRDGLPGIPGRDLSDDEVALYGGETALIETGLYERPPKPVTRPQVVKPKTDNANADETSI
jgi:hypothetical protein